MGILQSTANVLRSVLFTVWRILVSPWKDSNTTGLSRPILGAGKRKASSRSSSSEVERPSTAPVSASTRMQEVSKLQARVEANKQKEIEPKISLPSRQAITPLPSAAALKDITPAQSVEKSVPTDRSPESNSEGSYSQEEQELPTKYILLKENNSNKAASPKQPDTEGEDKKSDEGTQGNVEHTNSVAKIPAVPNESGEQPKAHQPSVLSECIDHQEDLIKNRSRKADKQKKQPTKYQPSIRTLDATKRTRGNNASQTEAITSRVHTFRMHLRVMLGHRNQFRISLLPERTKDLEEEIEIRGPDGQIATWPASQDEWYCDVVPLNFGELLINGAVWELSSETQQLRWVLSGREIYVLASSSAGTISGYLPVQRLILFEEHLVLCTKQQEKRVRQALSDAGCSDMGYVSDRDNLPEGWILFNNVRPTIAVSHDNSAGILNVLRPIHSIEIVLKGGIRLSHISWLNAHPPAISIRGTDSKELSVMIDGNTAYCGETGKYMAEAWNNPGHHVIFCGGVTRSYELVNTSNEWGFFNAFSYIQNVDNERMFNICGPAVLPGSENEYVSLAPSKNTCIIGTVPGQIAISSMDVGIRRDEYLAVADFPIVWVLPSNPLTCSKPNSYVKMISSEEVVKHIEVGNRKINQNILRWCHAILDASRRQLRVEPATEETKQLWGSYVKTARRYWRYLR